MENEIYEIEIIDGIIKSMSVYIGNKHDRYKHLMGYGEPQTGYNIARFFGEKSMAFVLKDIGIENFSYNLNEYNYNNAKAILTKISDKFRFNVNDKRICTLASDFSDIKKVELDSCEKIENITINLQEGVSSDPISANVYMNMYYMVNKYKNENEVVENILKKCFVLKSDGKEYKHYKEKEDCVIVRIVRGTKFSKYEGVFSVNPNKDLLHFIAIEDGIMTTYDGKEEIAKGSSFFISAKEIRIMKY